MSEDKKRWTEGRERSRERARERARERERESEEGGGGRNGDGHACDKECDSAELCFLCLTLTLSTRDVDPFHPQEKIMYIHVGLYIQIKKRQRRKNDI